jgi:hypothetical protein
VKTSCASRARKKSSVTMKGSTKATFIAKLTAAEISISTARSSLTEANHSDTVVDLSCTSRSYEVNTNTLKTLITSASSVSPNLSKIFWKTPRSAIDMTSVIVEKTDMRTSTSAAASIPTSMLLIAPSMMANEISLSLQIPPKTSSKASIATVTSTLPSAIIICTKSIANISDFDDSALANFSRRELSMNSKDVSNMAKETKLASSTKDREMANCKTSSSLNPFAPKYAMRTRFSAVKTDEISSIIAAAPPEKAALWAMTDCIVFALISAVKATSVTASMI